MNFLSLDRLRGPSVSPSGDCRPQTTPAAVSETFYTNVRMRAGMSSASRKFCIPWSHAGGITSGLVDLSIPASVRCAGQEVVNVGQVARIPMLRMKVLLLLALTSVVFAGWSGVGEAETSKGVGSPPSGAH